MGRLRVRLLATIAAALAMSSTAQGYYHFIQYFTRSSPYSPIAAKFDVNALNNKTVPFLIAEQGPAALASGDTFAGLVSQIRLAAKTWNDVVSSDLRLSFGGFFTPGVQQSGPAIEVIFDDVPPGLVALGGISSRADVTSNDSGLFVPIAKSTVVLGRDLSQRASWTEAFFLSVTHEFGHALGLQHTLTSGVMATELTRATTKSAPLSADDVVGISLLYPTANRLAGTGSIQGRVVQGNAGVFMASVVAIAADGIAISAVTNPDGTYRIDGVPQGSYYVYAHPLPPAVSGESYPAGITPPLDPDGRGMSAGISFETQFYPGTKDPVRATPIPVYGGSVSDGINFSVTRRNSPAVFGVTTYSYPAQVAVKPAYLPIDGGRRFLIAAGYGLTSNVNAQVLGGTVTIPNGGVKPYSQDARFTQLDLQFGLTSGEGSRHLLFSADNDLYVLPAGLRLTRRMPPQISSVSPGVDASGSRIVTINGSGLGSTTSILFDGIPAVVKSADDANSVLVVAPPPGPLGQRAAVVALNGDGQSSLFVQAAAGYDYDNGDSPAFSISPAQLPAGAESMVEIQGNTQFALQFINLSFGSSGVTVRRVWDGGAGRLLANIAVSASAAPGAYTAAILNGVRMMTQSGGFQIIPAAGRVSTLQGPIVDAATGRLDIPAGAVAQVRVAGAAADAAQGAVQVTVSDRPAQVVTWGGGALTFRVPAGLPAGPAVVRVTAGSETPRALVMSIDTPAPTIISVQVSGARVDSLRPARPGELLTATVVGLADTGQDVATPRVAVAVNGTPQIVTVVTQNPAGGHNVQFLLDPNTATGSQTLVVSVDGRPSSTFNLPVSR